MLEHAIFVPSTIVSTLLPLFDDVRSLLRGTRLFVVQANHDASLYQYKEIRVNGRLRLQNSNKSETADTAPLAWCVGDPYDINAAIFRHVHRPRLAPGM